MFPTPTCPDGTPLLPVGHKRLRPPADLVMAAARPKVRHGLDHVILPKLADGSFRWSVDSVTYTCAVTGTGPVVPAHADMSVAVDDDVLSLLMLEPDRSAAATDADWDDAAGRYQTVTLFSVAFTWADPHILHIDPDVDVWTVTSRQGKTLTSIVTGRRTLPDPAQYAALRTAADATDGQFRTFPAWHPATINAALAEWASYLGVTDPAATYDPDLGPSRFIAEATASLDGLVDDAGRIRPDRIATTCHGCVLGEPVGTFIVATPRGDDATTATLCRDCADGHPAC